GSQRLRQRPQRVYLGSALLLREQPCAVPGHLVVCPCRGRAAQVVLHQLQCGSPCLCQERQLLRGKQHLRASDHHGLHRQGLLLSEDGRQRNQVVRNRVCITKLSPCRQAGR